MTDSHPIYKDFVAKLPLIDEKTKQLEKELRKVLDIAQFHYEDTISRVKSVKSMKAKLDVKPYDSLLMVSDSGGVRIVLADPNDVEETKELFLTYFPYGVDSEPPAGKDFWIREIVPPDSHQSAYDCPHLVVAFRDEFSIEIQFHSTLDHFVFSATHAIYKSGKLTAEQTETLKLFVAAKSNMDKALSHLKRGDMDSFHRLFIGTAEVTAVDVLKTIMSRTFPDKSVRKSLVGIHFRERAAAQRWYSSQSFREACEVGVKKGWILEGNELMALRTLRYNPNLTSNFATQCQINPTDGKH